MNTPALEQLVFSVPAARIGSFFQADAATWTAFLSTVDGFAGKFQLYDKNATSGNVTVSGVVLWNSIEKWKAINFRGEAASSGRALC